MNDDHDKAWDELAKRAHKGERHIISGKELERLLGELPEDELEEQDLEDIVGAVMSERSLCDVRGVTKDEAPAAEVPETKSIEKDVLQLNRNKGEKDEEAESRLEELRRDALEDDVEDEDA